MIKQIKFSLKSFRSNLNINNSLIRGTISNLSRVIDLTNPQSWEFSGFSQNGEDGILDILTSQLIQDDKYFIEIGSSDGLENNTTWLSLVKKYSGIWIEGNKNDYVFAKYIFEKQNYGVEIINLYVTAENLKNISNKSFLKNPDVFSLDIDGNDFFIAKSILSNNIRPKIFVVEYNSAFGPYNSLTIPYKKDFKVINNKINNLYYGCSITGWKKLFEGFNYKFLTVESNGVNAFFVEPTYFKQNFINNINGNPFKENFSQFREYKCNWESQFELIKNKEFMYL